MSLKREITMNPVFGEISPRRAPAVIANQELKFGLREVHNCLITRNLEVAIRPPTKDKGPLPDNDESVTRSFQFRFPDGNFTVLTFSALEINQHVVGSEYTLPAAIATDWTAADIALMDGAQDELEMMFVTPGKEPRYLIYNAVTPGFTWVTVQSVTTAAAPSHDPPWHTDSDWPVSVSFMIGRFICVSARKYYGSQLRASLIGAAITGPPLWKISDKTVDGETVVTAASAFSFDAADDLDSGFKWIKGGSLAFAGSPAGAWMMSNYENGLDATNPNIKNYSTVGSYDVKAADINGGMAYFTSDGRTMKIFAVTPEGPIHQELNQYSKHIFEESSPVRMVFQRTPDTILWILRADGNLIAFCMDDTRRAWCRIETDGDIKDIWLGKDNTQEYLYLDVDRGIDRRVERIENIDPLEETFFGDDQVVSATSAAQSPTVETDDSGVGSYTIAGHGYLNGDLIRLIDFADQSYGYVVLVDVNTIKIQFSNKNMMPFGTGIAFSVREAIFTKTIAHFANKTLDIFSDNYYSQVTADGSGVITLQVPASDLIVCLPYKAYIQPQSFMHVQLFDRAVVNLILPRLYQTKSILYGRADVADTKLTSKNLSVDGYSGVEPDLPIGGGMDYECSYRIGGEHNVFILVSCFAEIDVGEN